MSIVEQQIAKKISDEFSQKKLLSSSRLAGIVDKMCQTGLSASDWRMLAELSIKEEERNAAAQTPNS